MMMAGLLTGVDGSCSPRWEEDWPCELKMMGVAVQAFLKALGRLFLLRLGAGISLLFPHPKRAQGIDHHRGAEGH